MWCGVVWCGTGQSGLKQPNAVRGGGGLSCGLALAQGKERVAALSKAFAICAGHARHQYVAERMA
jgi:hypothetical protein